MARALRNDYPLDRRSIARYEARIAAYEAGDRAARLAPATSRATPRPRSRATPRSRSRSVRRRRRPAGGGSPSGGPSRSSSSSSSPSSLSPTRARCWHRPTSASVFAQSSGCETTAALGWCPISSASTIPSTLPQREGRRCGRCPASACRTASAESVYAPPPIAPVISPPLPGEGEWRRNGTAGNGAPPLLVTTFRPDPSYPQMIAGVAWMDRSRTSLQLYPGRYEPPAGAYRGPMEVPPKLRGGLLATFNSGFKLEDSGGGFAALGQVYAPLHDGQADARRASRWQRRRACMDRRGHSPDHRCSSRVRTSP